MDIQPQIPEVTYVAYSNEGQLPIMMEMIASELSEPYSIYTYRYFVTYWPNMCFIAYIKDKMVGVVIGKLERHNKTIRGQDFLKLIKKKGYLAMIVVLKEYRRLKIGKKLVELLIDELKKFECDELVLETETTNIAALRFYESLGFIKEKKQANYYMSGNGAYRLKLYFSSPEEIDQKFEKYTEIIQNNPMKPDPKFHINDLITNPEFKDTQNYWNYFNQKKNQIEIK